MAVQVRYIRDGTINGLEGRLNAFLADASEDVRIIVEVVTSFYAADSGEYVAVVQRSAPHLRRFGDDEREQP